LSTLACFATAWCGLISKDERTAKYRKQAIR
jgi:hypothetical protein